MTENHARISPALVETIAGLSAGTASTLAVHPLDVIKTRLQIHRSTSHTPASGLTILRSLTQQPQPLQSLYRGLTPNLIGNASSWALFFYFKNIFESSLRSFHNQPSHSNYASLTPIDYFLASGSAGIMITITTNPIWVLKTRMLSSDRSSKGAYQSMWHGARHLWQHEGVRGFYRGVGISLLGNSHGAVQFAVYEPLKNFWRNHCSHQTLRGDRESSQVKLGNTATLLLSSSAKIIAGTATYPYQVVRSRLQTYDAEERFGKGIRGVVGKVWREEGWRGFYRGLGTNIVRVLPATWVTFLVYENARFYLPRQWNRDGEE
ncbi:hypothetical protein BGAL_0651g00040 [Botrytis galanthina]|uniref:Mitochondrial thiamine pyrophosphate carrier 1 n=1 Tax=Botrytis galanthina TaxID=278940 RepID=A0A4S8QHW7_9HELO|nr:hypothetical protein BGAL_0651g00040 [Botrytis galanthina]